MCAGTELLAFEGEIALIIGAPAKDVSLEEAWKHVAFVTASNDVGLYDYRAADKGSNTRSKSRDGYTPIGPRLIDAQAIDPKQLRLRTWVNGELVQEGDTSDAEMIFPSRNSSPIFPSISPSRRGTLSSRARQRDRRLSCQAMSSRSRLMSQESPVRDA